MFHIVRQAIIEDLNTMVHEGEYVLIPASRLPLPISRSDSINSIGPASKTLGREYSPTLELEGDNNGDIKSSYSAELMPSLVHKWTHTHSILCVMPAPTKGLIFCGTQDSKILVYDLRNYNLKYEISTGVQGCEVSTLSLAISENERYLFSVGSDSLVKVWDLAGIEDENINEVPCKHIIYSSLDIGDIFSIAWSDALSTVFIGAQNAALLWCYLPLDDLEPEQNHPTTLERLPHFRYDKFFDSKGPGGSINSLQYKHQEFKDSSADINSRSNLIEISNEDLIRFAHNGYIYCMEIYNCNNQVNYIFNSYADIYQNILVSCGGDGMVNIWGIKKEKSKISITKIKALANEESVLSMTMQDSFLFLGLSDSSIKVWDLSTFQLVRSYAFSSESEKPDSYDEVLSLGIYNNCIFKSSNIGGLIKFTLKKNSSILPGSQKSERAAIVDVDDEISDIFKKHNSNNSVLAVNIFTLPSGSTYMISGGHKAMCLWDITDVGSRARYRSVGALFENKPLDLSAGSEVVNEHLLQTLSQFISFKTVLKLPYLYLEESRQCAKYLMKLFSKVGACETKLLPVKNGNPVVYSKFSRSKKFSDSDVKVLWYGHYDVVDADKEDDWETEPFVMTAKNGNLYGRGVSDNKGPILAAIYAVAELHSKEQLSCDVTFVIEGEEECGSIGFQNVINENKYLIGDIDWIMLSNSYWIDDETPCLNYGLRGVIHASITVQSEKPDRHSGVDGGVLKEPTMDLVQIIAQLNDSKSNKINLEGFYDDILPLTETEIEIFKKVEKVAIKNKIYNQDLETLMAKWRNPSLTVHKIEVSGPNNNSVIPQIAKANISLRIVPNQELPVIKEALVKHLEETFKNLKSDNKLLIDIFHEAEPWLGDPSNLVYQILYEKMRSNWGLNVAEPLFVREGGSIPSIRFLEKSFKAQAAQIPCGQESDNAHLKDEKLRINNLFKLRAILSDTLRELGTRKA